MSNLPVFDGVVPLKINKTIKIKVKIVSITDFKREIIKDKEIKEIRNSAYKLLIPILILFTTLPSSAQLIKGTTSAFSSLSVGGVSVNGISNSWTLDKLSKTKLATPFMMSEAIKENTTNINFGFGLIGTGSASDPIRIDRALMLENIFYEETLDNIRYWRKLEKMIFWAKDAQCYVFWSKGTLRRILSEPVDQPAAVRSSDDVTRKLVKRIEALEAEAKLLKTKK